MIQPDLLYTTEEVASLLKVAPITIKRYIADNKIQSSKISGLRRIKGEELISLTTKKQELSSTIDLFASVYLFLCFFVPFCKFKIDEIASALPFLIF